MIFLPGNMDSPWRLLLGLLAFLVGDNDYRAHWSIERWWRRYKGARRCRPNPRYTVAC